MPKRNFQNKRVLITGAGSGLGAALSSRFCRAGATVIGIDLDPKGLQQTATAIEAINGRFVTHTCDIRDEEQLYAILHSVLGQGDVDVLINNAGISHRSEFLYTRASVIRKVMEINYLGAVYCTDVLLPGIIRQKGMIISVSSVAGFSPLIARTGYAASKHAVHGFFDSLRSEVSGSGVAVMLVCPSFIKTNIGRNALGADGNLVTHRQVPIGNFMSADIAAEKIFDAAVHNKKQLLLGKVAKLAYWTQKLVPGIYARQMAKKLQTELQREPV